MRDRSALLSLRLTHMLVKYGIKTMCSLICVYLYVCCRPHSGSDWELDCLSAGGREGGLPVQTPVPRVSVPERSRPTLTASDRLVAALHGWCGRRHALGARNRTSSSTVVTSSARSIARCPSSGDSKVVGSSATWGTYKKNAGLVVVSGCGCQTPSLNPERFRV